jgi:chemotaxis protein CheX
MKAEYINPFVNATIEAFDKMLGCEVRRGALTLKTGRNTAFEISGVIGLSGNAIGTVVLSFSKELALKAAGALLMTEMTEISGDVVDAVGELTNMVAGSAKSKLEELELSISLPNVITGSGHEIRFPSEVTPICIPFDSPWGPLTVEVGLAPVTATVGT